MADMFKIDTKQLKKLEKFYKSSPRMMQQISAHYLTALARETEKNARKVLTKTMTIRQPAIVKNNVKSWAARPISIPQQEAKAGSLRRERFTGWVEQEFGQRSPATHMPTTAARTGGSKSRIVAQSNRLKTTNQVKHLGDYQHKGRAGKSNKSREASMLRQMLADNYRGLFSLSGRGLKGYKQGIYKLDWRKKKSKKGGYRGKGPAPRALTRVQITGLHGTSPKPNKWLSRSLDMTYKPTVTQAAWNKAAKAILLKNLHLASK